MKRRIWESPQPFEFMRGDALPPKLLRQTADEVLDIERGSYVGHGFSLLSTRR